MVGGDGGGSGVRIGFHAGLLIELNETRNPVSQYLPLQSGIRNTDGLLAHRRASSPQTGY